MPRLCKQCWLDIGVSRFTIHGKHPRFYGWGFWLLHSVGAETPLSRNLVLAEGPRWLQLFHVATCLCSPAARHFFSGWFWHSVATGLAVSKTDDDEYNLYFTMANLIRRFKVFTWCWSICLTWHVHILVEIFIPRLLRLWRPVPRSIILQLMRGTLGLPTGAGLESCKVA